MAFLIALQEYQRVKKCKGRLSLVRNPAITNEEVRSKYRFHTWARSNPKGGVRLGEGREGIQYIKCQLRLGKTFQEELGILCGEGVKIDFRKTSFLSVSRRNFF